MGAAGDAVHTEECNTRFAGSALGSDPRNSPLVDTVFDAIEGVEFGAIEITIHDSRIIQVELRERLGPHKGPMI